jgi:hypothetical protein
MKPAGGQPAVERRIDECGEVLRVENLARHRDRCGARNELGRCELALRVAANRCEDILALLLQAAPRESIGIEF